ncbi:MAG: restriction endonuclease subunit S, partial [Deltaproteobacteria bacterium]|nr:restriction endonuclease subunit S [Deltaproteobacteria bacterium]
VDTHVTIVRPETGTVNARYLAYVLRQCEPSITHMAKGATNQVELSARDLSFLPIKLRDKREQDRIASILSAYDDLIENNRRRIQLLEESARLLYTEWFVRLHFPGHEHVKIIDGVPEGWEKKKIAEVSDTYGGGTPSTKVSEYWVGGNITWFIPKDLTNNDCLVLLDSEKKITEEGLKKSSAKMLPPETILMTSRASIGYFGLYDGAACTNQGFISIVPKKDFLKLYLLHNLMGRKEEILSRSGGTTYKEINKTTFRNMSLVTPPDHLLKQFDSFAYDVVKQARILKKQEAALKQARDLLLPRLMNGEIEV